MDRGECLIASGLVPGAQPHHSWGRGGRLVDRLPPLAACPAVHVLHFPSDTGAPAHLGNDVHFSWQLLYPEGWWSINNQANCINPFIFTIFHSNLSTCWLHGHRWDGFDLCSEWTQQGKIGLGMHYCLQTKSTNTQRHPCWGCLCFCVLFNHGKALPVFTLSKVNAT